MPFTMSAYLDVQIPTGERAVGRVCGIFICVAKLLLDGMKSFYQVRTTHLFVKEIH